MTKEVGGVSTETAMFVFAWKTGSGLPTGARSPGAISGGSVDGLAEALQVDGNTSGAVDGVDLGTGVDDHRAEARTGGHDFQLGLARGGTGSPESDTG